MRRHRFYIARQSTTTVIRRIRRNHDSNISQRRTTFKSGAVATATTTLDLMRSDGNTSTIESAPFYDSISHYRKQALNPEYNLTSKLQDKTMVGSSLMNLLETRLFDSRRQLDHYPRCYSSHVREP